MKTFLVLAITVLATLANAAGTMKMNYVNEDLPKIIEEYSKATGQKFIVDGTVRGKITILNQTPVSHEEAFNQMSESLAINGFAIISQGEVMIVRNARSAQRDNIPVLTEVPAARPQRMVTLLVPLKHISAQDVQQQLRLLTSAYGEMSVSDKSNHLIISDWSGNLQRISDLLKKLDQPADPKIAKIVEQAKKDKVAWRKMKAASDAPVKNSEKENN